MLRAKRPNIFSSKRQDNSQVYNRTFTHLEQKQIRTLSEDDIYINEISRIVRSFRYIHGV